MRNKAGVGKYTFFTVVVSGSSTLAFFGLGSPSPSFDTCFSLPFGFFTSLWGWKCSLLTIPNMLYNSVQTQHRGKSKTEPTSSLFVLF